MPRAVDGDVLFGDRRFILPVFLDGLAPWCDKWRLPSPKSEDDLCGDLKRFLAAWRGTRFFSAMDIAVVGGPSSLSDFSSASSPETWVVWVARILRFHVSISSSGSDASPNKENGDELALSERPLKDLQRRFRADDVFFITARQHVSAVEPAFSQRFLAELDRWSNICFRVNLR